MECLALVGPKLSPQRKWNVFLQGIKIWLGDIPHKQMFRQRPGKMRQYRSMMFVPVAPPLIKYRFNVAIALKPTIYVSIAARAMGIPDSDPCLTIAGVQDEQGVRIMRMQFPKVFIAFNHIVDGYGFHV